MKKNYTQTAFIKGQKVQIKCIEPGTKDEYYIFTQSMVMWWNAETTVIEILHNGCLRLKCTGKKIGWSPNWVIPGGLLDDINFDI